jgi:hypothetical protein
MDIVYEADADTVSVISSMTVLTSIIGEPALTIVTDSNHLSGGIQQQQLRHSGHLVCVLATRQHQIAAV